jgi:hypothetical protein
MSAATGQSRPTDGRWRKWLRGSLVFLALLTVARLVLEVAGVPHTLTRYFSSSAVIFLVAIYLGAVASLRGVSRFAQLLLPAVVVAAWTGGWSILATVISALLRLERSHFAEPEDYGNLAHLGGHLLGHLVEIGVFAVVVLVLMAVPYFLRRWPVTVGPAAILGALVIIRYWAEAMQLPATTAAAWSSTVAVLACGFYLGGMGPRLGLTTFKQLLASALVIGWVWRFWVFLAALLSATVPFYKTHFFDSSTGRVAARLAQLLGFSVVEGFAAGLVVCGIATWISRATRPAIQA